METGKTIKNTVAIEAPASEVWDALINSEKTKVYMFGCEAVSDWKVGSELLWRGNYEGKETVFVKGRVINFEPVKKMSYTTFDPNSPFEDIPQNYLTVTYTLEEQDGKTHLTVTQGDYDKVADGERRFRESDNNGEGWNPILLEIKKLVEAN
jgi:uncharacterized protein YndB with AHSA1/START domain